MSNISIAIDTLDSHSDTNFNSSNNTPTKQNLHKNTSNSAHNTSRNEQLTKQHHIQGKNQYLSPLNAFISHRQDSNRHNRGNATTKRPSPGPSSNRLKNLFNSHNFSHNKYNPRQRSHQRNGVGFYLPSNDSLESVATTTAEEETGAKDKSVFLAWNDADIVNSNSDSSASSSARTNSIIYTSQIDIHDQYYEGDDDYTDYRLLGILLSAGTVVFFIASMASIFNLWGGVMLLLGFDSDTITQPQPFVFGRSYKSSIYSDFPVDNYYVYVILLCPAIFWIWCIVSWVGMKLFRHAKGIAIPE